MFIIMYVIVVHCLHYRQDSTSDPYIATTSSAQAAHATYNCTYPLHSVRQPVFLKNGEYLTPNADGDIELISNDTLTISCVGAGDIYCTNALNPRTTATVRCGPDNLLVNEAWLSSACPLSAFACHDSPQYTSERSCDTCFQGNPLIWVGYQIEGVFHKLYESCFDESELKVVYTKYEQKPHNANFQTGGERPYFISDGHFGRVPVERIYMQNGLRTALTDILGDHAERYFNKNEFLNRGHYTARTDFNFPFGQRATFHYLNCAPQWSGFNGGNWNTLEVDLRQRIGRAGYDTIIYTGTYGITQLLDKHAETVDIYLHRDHYNNPVIPVPLYYYKVVYEATRNLSTAYVGINNPYYTYNEARRLFFCNDVCRGNSDFRWLSWEPDNPRKGYSFCCHLSEFRRTVPHLPPFTAQGLHV